MISNSFSNVVASFCGAAVTNLSTPDIHPRCRTPPRLTSIRYQRRLETSKGVTLTIGHPLREPRGSLDLQKGSPLRRKPRRAWSRPDTVGKPGIQEVETVAADHVIYGTTMAPSRG